MEHIQGGMLDPVGATHTIMMEMGDSIQALRDDEITPIQFLTALDVSGETLSAIHGMLMQGALHMVQDKLTEEAMEAFDQVLEMREAMENEEATEIRRMELLNRVAMPVPQEARDAIEKMRRLIQGDSDD